MFSKILLAVDQSEHSGRAVPAAAEAARKFGAEIVVLHVRESVAGKAAGYDVESTTEAEAVADVVAKFLKEEGLSARPETRAAFYGHTAREIVDAARTEGAELIVLGSRGLSDLAGLMLGSVAHKVLQLSEIPVLVIR